MGGKLNIFQKEILQLEGINLMIKISFKFLILFSFISVYIVADDFKTKAKSNPQYPKSAYAKRIS